MSVYEDGMQPENEYELARLERIKENRRKLEALGLLRPHEPSARVVPRRSKARRASSAQKVPARRSGRLQGLAAQDLPEPYAPSSGKCDSGGRCSSSPAIRALKARAGEV